MAKKAAKGRYKASTNKSKTRPRASRKKGASKASKPVIAVPFHEWIQIDRVALIWLAGILLATGIAFSGGFDHEFTNWDDNVYVRDNPLVRGADAPNIGKIFSSDAQVAGNYHPVTMLSLAINHKVSEMNFGAYYGTNLLFHLLNTVLVFLFVYILLDKKAIPALITAFFFGVHPMHVESVAWIAERKDVLYTFFFFLSLLSYLRMRVGRGKLWYGLCFAFFTLSILSKPAAVVLPVILLLIDYFQKRAIDAKVLLEKVPFFILSIIIGLMILDIQKSVGALPAHDYGMGSKIFIGGYAFVTYIAMLFVPIKLSAFHAYPPDSLPILYKLAPVLAIAIVGGAIWYTKKSRLPLFGVGFFLITIALVLQVLSVGDTVISERYTYVPYVGLLLLLGMGVDWLLNQPWAKGGAKYGIIGAVIALGALSLYGTYDRVGKWENSGTLFSDAIDKYPYAAKPYISRGQYLSATDQDAALEDYNSALAIEEQYTAYNNRGDILLKKGQNAKAKSDFLRAIQMRKGFAQGYVNLGLAYLNLGKRDSAFIYFNTVITDPNLSKKLGNGLGNAYYARSVTYKQVGKRGKALKDAQKARQLGFPVKQAYLDGLK